MSVSSCGKWVKPNPQNLKPRGLWFSRNNTTAVASQDSKPAVHSNKERFSVKSIKPAVPHVGQNRCRVLNTEPLFGVPASLLSASLRRKMGRFFHPSFTGSGLRRFRLRDDGLWQDGRRQQRQTERRSLTGTHQQSWWFTEMNEQLSA